MNMSTSMRIVNRAFSVYRYRAVSQCSMVSSRIVSRGYTKTAENGEKKPENTTEAPKAEETPEQKLQSQIAKLKEELEESKKETLIAMADRQTSIRIAKDDVRKAKEYGIQKFATTLFDVNDVLERALASVKPETLASNEDLRNFYEGVQMTEKLLLKAYEQNDIKRFNPMGQKFDPNLHQALQEVPDPSQEPGTVCYVMKNGYQLKDRLLRAASVAVVKADPNAPKKDAPKKEDAPK